MTTLILTRDATQARSLRQVFKNILTDEADIYFGCYFSPLLGMSFDKVIVLYSPILENEIEWFNNELRIKILPEGTIQFLG